MGHKIRSPSRWRIICIYTPDGPRTFTLTELGKLADKPKQTRRSGKTLMDLAEKKPRPKFPLLEPSYTILPPKDFGNIFGEGSWETE
jgi:hypothetical protein